MSEREPQPHGSAPSSEAQAVVEVVALTRMFGRRRALDDLSFRLRSRECLALFGPNGAGKTTLLRVLAGLSRPSSGTVHVDGHAVPGGPDVRMSVGLISHQSMLYPALTARENVEFAATLYGLPDPAARAERALEQLGVGDRADTPVRLLSRGLQQRVAIARSVVHGPHLLLADEPYSGLDASGASTLTTLLRELCDNGATIVLVTHNVTEGLALATHAAVMDRGRFLRYEATAGLDPVAYSAEYRNLMAEHAA